MNQFRTRKRFGQHFLTDQGVLSDICGASQLSPKDVCIEIGPGQGALTKFLIQTGAQVHAVEIDQRLEPVLKNFSVKHSNFTFTMADVLKVPLSDLYSEDEKVTIVGNLPYEISTPLLFKLIDSRSSIRHMVFLLQKEVVDRMVAVPGTKAYGRLSVMTQYYFSAEALTLVPAESFSPPPNVLSQVIKLEPLQREWVDHQSLESFVKYLFAQRRKMLRQRFKSYLSDQDWKMLGLDPTLRPQDLDLDMILKMFMCLHEKGSQF